MDDVWAMVGSDNLNRRSWSHDSELSIGVLDHTRDTRAPVDPAGLGDGARTFARDLRLRLWREHLDRAGDDVADLLDPAAAFAAFRAPGRAAGHLARGRGGRGAAAGAGDAAPGDRAERGAAGVGHPAVPGAVRPGRPPVAGPAARPPVARLAAGAIRGDSNLLSHLPLRSQTAGWWGRANLKVRGCEDAGRHAPRGAGPYRQHHGSH